MGPTAGLNGCGKSRPHRDSIPVTVQPVASHYTNYAIPAHVPDKDLVISFALPPTHAIKQLRGILKSLSDLPIQ